MRRWKKANPDKVKAQKQRYRSRRSQSPLPPRRYSLRHREVKCPEKVQLSNLVVVLKDYRKEDTLPCRREKVDKRQKNRSYYQQNRDSILTQRRESRQKDPEGFRVKETKRKREYRERNRDRVLAKGKEYRQRNLDKIRERERERKRRYAVDHRARCNQRNREYYQRNRDRILSERKEYRQRNLEKFRERKRQADRQYYDNNKARYRQRNREKIRERDRRFYANHRARRNQQNRECYQRKRDGQRDETRDCDCGLCLVCGGFATVSWSSRFELPEVDLEGLDQRCHSESDTSSLVDPQLVEELERMLNEPSECSDLSDEEEDELEERLIAIRTHREQGIQRRLERWEREESIQCLAGDLDAVNEQLVDMERAFTQFRREDAVAQAPEFEYLHTVAITSDLMTQLEQDLL